MSASSADDSVLDVSTPASTGQETLPPSALQHERATVSRSRPSRSATIAPEGKTPSPDQESSPQQRRWVKPALGLVLLLGGLAVLLLISARHDRPPAGADTAPNHARASEKPQKEDASAGGSGVVTIPVGNEPLGVAYGAGAIWVANSDEATVSRIDPSRNRAVAAIPVGRSPTDVIVRSGIVWVTNSDDDTVSRIDSRTNRPIGRPLHVGDGPGGIVSSGRSVWVANMRDGSVTRIDAATNRPQGRPIKVSHDPEALAAGRGAVWVAGGGRVTRISTKSGKVDATVKVGSHVSIGNAVAVGAGQVWVADAASGRVLQLDPRTGRRVGRPISSSVSSPDSLAISRRSVWVGGDDGVMRLKLPSRTHAETVIPLDSTGDVAVGSGAAWAASFSANTVTRIPD